MDAPARPAGFDQVGPAPVGLGALAGLREAAIGALIDTRLSNDLECLIYNNTL